MKYRPEIDGLRALAVVPVILFHAGFETFSGGFVGVDVFFVISGYLITSIILEDIRGAGFSIARFYERRARRILPALLVVCFACIPAAWLLMSPWEYKDFSQSLLAVAVFASNILFWLKTDYFEAATELKPLLHTWSLAVEEQFYLVFPLLLVALVRFGYRLVFTVLSALAVASLVLSIAWTNIEPAGAFYLIPTRAWELGVGGIVAVAQSRWRPTRSWSANIATGTGVAMILLAIVWFDETTPFPGYLAAVPVIGTALTIHFGSEASWVSPLLRHPAAVNIGLASYSLYLWHQPALAFLRLSRPYEPSLPEVLLTLLAAAALSFATWKYVESPFRNRRRVPTRAVWAMAISGSLVLSASGIAGHLTEGLRDLTPTRVAATKAEGRLAGNHGLHSVCDNEFTLAKECRTSDQPEIAVWGDSFAMHLVDGILASKPGVGLIQFTKSACGPIVGLAPITAKYPTEWAKGCLQFNKQVLDWIEASPSIKFVVLSSPFEQYSKHMAWFLTPQGRIEADWTIAAAGLVDTIETLQAHGVQAVVVSPPPSFGGDIGRCLLRATYRNLPLTSCDFQEAQYRDMNFEVNRFLTEAGRQVRVIWLDQTLCRQGKCAATLNGAFVYRDRGHLSREGSAALGKEANLYGLIAGSGTGGIPGRTASRAD